MCKKIGIAVVAVLVGLFVVKKTEVGSWLKVCWKEGKAAIRNQIPLEQEIARLKSDLANLDKADARHYDAVAEKIVIVEKLRKEVASDRVALEDQERSIRVLNDDLKSDKTTFVYVTGSYTRAEVEGDLRRKFEYAKKNKATLEAKQKKLEALEEGMNKAKEQLREMKNVRKDMEIEIARLEAELENLNLAKLRSDVQLDDSEYARIREGMNRVNDRINVQLESLSLQREYGKIRVEVKEKPADKNLTQEVDTFLGAKNGIVVDKK